MMLQIYQILTSITGPLIDLYLIKRKNMGKEDPKRFQERLGHAALPRPNGALTWIHAASVGEALSVLPLIKKMSEVHSSMHFLLTTGTTTSAKLVESRLPDRAFHQYVPVDRISCVRRFLRHWRPDLALWVESEFWPNLVTETARFCPIILINGRVSDDSYQKWQRYKSFSQQVLSRFSLALPQSRHDAERIEKLGARNVKYLGNLKYDAPALPSDSQKMGELVSMIGQRVAWLAASTHEGEEKEIAKVHLELKETHTELLTIIAPRHPKRSEEILAELTAMNLNCAVRSKNDPITAETDIYIADTLGELGIFYRLVPIVFIGGSLAERGGQNPLEAARLNCTIIYGPNMDNFLEIKREFDEKNAAVSIKDTEGLKHAVEELIMDNDKQELLAQAAQQLVQEKSGIMDAYIEEINPYIAKIQNIKNAAA